MAGSTEMGGERQRLSSGCSKLQLEINDKALDQLMQYGALLRKWNRTYNVVSASGLAGLVSLHLLDSLSIHSFVKPGTLLDVGTGAGFPGMPLAITHPDLQCALLDSVGKKIRFLSHVKRSLDLKNISLLEMRVGDFNSEQKFDNISSRAFSSLVDFVSSVRH